MTKDDELTTKTESSRFPLIMIIVVFLILYLIILLPSYDNYKDESKFGIVASKTFASLGLLALIAEAYLIYQKRWDSKWFMVLLFAMFVFLMVSLVILGFSTESKETKQKKPQEKKEQAEPEIDNYKLSVASVVALTQISDKLDSLDTNLQYYIDKVNTRTRHERRRKRYSKIVK